MQSQIQEQLNQCMTRAKRLKFKGEKLEIEENPPKKAPPSDPKSNNSSVSNEVLGFQEKSIL